MQAAWYETIGSADEVLQVGEIDNPSPGQGDVLVQMKTSGVNPSDVKPELGLEVSCNFQKSFLIRMVVV